MFVETIVSADFKQATGGHSFLLPQEGSEQASAPEVSISPVSVSTGLVGPGHAFENLEGTIINYGAVPERFVPELPDIDTLENIMLRIVMDKSTLGALMVISLFSWTGGINGNVYRISYGPDGPTILSCEYIGPKPPFQLKELVSPEYYPRIYRFWLGSEPSGLREDFQLHRTNNAASQCPETETEAVALYKS